MPMAPPRCATLPAGASKETDRIAAMATELRKLGATVGRRSGLHPSHASGRIADWQAASIHTYDDHRVAMCFSLAAFNPAAVPVRIEDPKCVAKTFPDYFEALFSVAHGRYTEHSGDLRRWPHGLRQRHAWLRFWQQQLGYHFLDSGSLYRITGAGGEPCGHSIGSGQ